MTTEPTCYAVWFRKPRGRWQKLATVHGYDAALAVVRASREPRADFHIAPTSTSRRFSARRSRGRCSPPPTARNPSRRPER